MYYDVGKKLMFLAKFGAFIGALSGIIGGIFIISIGFMWIGIFVMLLIPFVSIVSSYGLYALGEIANNASETNYYVKTMFDKSLSSGDKEHSISGKRKAESPKVENAEKDNEKTYDSMTEQAVSIVLDSNKEGVCPKCGKRMSFESWSKFQRCVHCKTYLKVEKS